MTDSHQQAGADRTIAQVRRVFERRAATFDDVSFLPREIATRMASRLDYIKVEPQRVLDAGCGPGSDLSALQLRYADAGVIGVDLSRRMLSRAAAERGLSRMPGWLKRFIPSSRQVVQADFARLPFADATFDLLWSNLALHWHPRPDRVFPEWRRVLGAGGLLMFSVFGPDTLKEVRAAWRVAEDRLGLPPREHVLPFVDMHDFGDMLVANGFETPVMDMETLTITYRSPEALLADVRRLGAYVPMHRSDAEADAPSGGLGSRRLRDALSEALDERFQSGTLPLTFEIAYGHAWRRPDDTSRDAQGNAVIRLDQIGRRRRAAD
ncbi:methyltransferase domain-containing protein [Chitinasiproducens palmae]|uniref:Malonyl-[acyl-carrier protein] O-methyltransferase n=1 Tax=Chitinasiproducens palmae TaxID=1770053 RepID=A0A1H2PNL4_9BURK|nr:methyltransferase domain-containing protein [Chitinasiproducens palmae]SDV48244.1 malonyl-CoA O-methyltransferase [Chitinasiproducens palmae]